MTPTGARPSVALMQRARDVLGWLLPLALLTLAIVSVPVLAFDEEGLPRWRALRRELGEVAHQNDAMRRQVEELARDVDALRTDPEAIEHIARDDLGMVREGELVFQFPE